MTVDVLWLFLKVLWVYLQCVMVVFPDHTHLLFEPSFLPKSYVLTVIFPYCLPKVNLNETVLLNTYIFFFIQIDNLKGVLIIIEHIK